MARALLLPSFHSRICLAAFQLLAETQLLLLLLLLPGEDSQINSPLMLTCTKVGISVLQRGLKELHLLTRPWGAVGLAGSTGLPVEPSASPSFPCSTPSLCDRVRRGVRGKSEQENQGIPRNTELGVRAADSRP